MSPRPPKRDAAKPSKTKAVSAVRDNTSTPKHGATWWGRRWIEALEHGSRDMVARLGKGRAYARDGHVHGLRVTSGQVTATVTDDELDSYRVSLKLEAFDNATWQRILHTMGAQALNAAKLLNGEMPNDIDKVFRACGKTLFPHQHEIDADCSCEDWTAPCKHVAATHYVLGDALDQDPFLLFELRGRRKEQVLATLGRMRAQHSESVPVVAEAVSSLHCPLSSLNPQRYDQGLAPLPQFSFHFATSAADEASAANLIRSLGKPASWPLSTSPAELLQPALNAARERALELASGNAQLQLTHAAEKIKR